MVEGISDVSVVCTSGVMAEDTSDVVVGDILKVTVWGTTNCEVDIFDVMLVGISDITSVDTSNVGVVDILDIAMVYIIIWKDYFISLYTIPLGTCEEG